MANTKSAKKAIRSSNKKYVINLSRKRKMKDAIKSLKLLISKADKTNAQSSLKLAYKEIDKSAKANIIHKNTAGRYKSALSAKVKAIK